MDAAKGPSVPLMRRYLEHFKGLRDVEHSNKPPRQSGHTADAGSSAALYRMQFAAVSILLRNQPSPYIDDELQAVQLAKQPTHPVGYLKFMDLVLWWNAIVGQLVGIFI